MFKPNIEKLKRNKDISGLIRALNYEDYGIQEKALEALRKIEDKKAVDAIFKFIGEINNSLIKDMISLKKILLFQLLILASDARESDFANYSKNKSAEAIINMCKEEPLAMNHLIDLYEGGYGSSEVIRKIFLNIAKDQIDNLIWPLRTKIAFYDSPNVWKGYEKKQKLERLSDEVIVSAGRQAAVPLCRYLKSNDKQNRIWASYRISEALRLGQIENEPVVKDLIIALNDSDSVEFSYNK